MNLKASGFQPWVRMRLTWGALKPLIPRPHLNQLVKSWEWLLAIDSLLISLGIKKNIAKFGNKQKEPFSVMLDHCLAGPSEDCLTLGQCTFTEFTVY